MAFLKKLKAEKTAGLRGQIFLILSALLSLAAAPAAEESPSRLELADRIRLIESGDGSQRPYFRTEFNIVSKDASTVSVEPPQDPNAALEIVEANGSVYHPLSLHYVQEANESARPDSAIARYALLLIDISGSMLDSAESGDGLRIKASKYETAKLAVRKFLQGFHSNQDHVAIVPFESHQVMERIQAAKFADSLDQAIQELDQMPAPKRDYNTALYSASQEALKILTDIKKSKPNASVLLVILTDGQNQILPGDDPDLSGGEEGLAEAVSNVNDAGIQVMTIGFGDETIPLGKKGAIDVQALRRLAWPTESNFHIAQDVKSLGELFGVARQLLVNRWQLTFTTNRTDRVQLTGQDLRIQLRFQLAGRTLQSSWISFKTPQMGAPPFEGHLQPDEKAELRAAAAQTQPDRGRSVALYRVKILLMSGGFLLVMWWVVPLFVWPRPSKPKPKIATKVSQTPSDPSAPEKALRRDDPASTIILEPTTNPLGPVETQIHFEPLTSSKHSPDATLLDFRGQEKPSSPGDTIIDPRGMETLIRFPAEPPQPRKEKKEK